MSGKENSRAAPASLFGWLLSMLTFLLCVATAAGFMARWWWPFELACHFRVQYGLLLAVATLLWLLGRRWKQVLIATVFAAANLAVVYPLYVRPTADLAAGETFRVVSLNVMMDNRQYQNVLQMVRETEPDFLALLEVDSRWTDALAELKTVYPFSHELPQVSNFGLSLYSRHKIESVEVEHLGDFNVPVIVAHCDVRGQPLTIIVTHTFPPVGEARAHQRNVQLTDLAKVVAAQQGANAQRGPVILVGDLNVTSFSPYFHDLLRDSGLRDSQLGFGVQPTWSTDMPLLRIPIDHCLTSSQIDIHNRRVGPHVGSDHFGLIIDFSISDR